MASKPQETERARVETERQLLRAMCNRHISDEEIMAVTVPLGNYAWRVPEHATVFQAIQSVIRLNRAWRELLPAQATRMGFPDVEWSQYLETDRDGAPPLNGLVRRLCTDQ